jgi:hypothetical protein
MKYEDVVVGGTYQVNHNIDFISETLKKGTKVKVLRKVNYFTDTIDTELALNKYVSTIYRCSASEISPIKKKHKPFIVIYRDGNRIVAKNVITGVQGVARCSTKDEFDYDVGAYLAVQRLTRNVPTQLEKDIKELVEKYLDKE